MYKMIDEETRPFKSVFYVPKLLSLFVSEFRKNLILLRYNYIIEISIFIWREFVYNNNELNANIFNLKKLRLQVQERIILEDKENTNLLTY